jgi:hypothetical protein
MIGQQLTALKRHHAADAVHLDWRGNDIGFLEAELIAQRQLKFHTACKSRVDAHLNNAGIARRRQHSVDADPVDSQMPRDLSLGLPFHEIEPGGPRHRLLVTVMTMSGNQSVALVFRLRIGTLLNHPACLW